MTQKEHIKRLLAGKDGANIDDIMKQTGFLRPNVRRILGTGAKDGTFERIDKGVYTLKTNEKVSVCYVELGLAQEILPRLVSEGYKYDMIFLDPAYYSPNLVGRKRNPIKYDFIMPEDFASVVRSVFDLIKEEDSHIYLMLSGAPSTQKDMKHYIDAAISHGLKYVKEGYYRKTCKDGSDVLNIRGLPASPERLILLSKSGTVRECSKSLELEISAVRPPIKTSYSTEKPTQLIDPIILQSTFESEIILDPFAGTGIVGERAVTNKRYAHLIEAKEDTIETHITKKLIKAV